MARRRAGSSSTAPRASSPTATSRSPTWVSSPTGPSTSFSRRSPTSCRSARRADAPAARPALKSRLADARGAVSPARGSRSDGGGRRSRPHPRPGRGADPGHRRGAESHRSVAAPGTAGAARGPAARLGRRRLRGGVGARSRGRGARRCRRGGPGAGQSRALLRPLRGLPGRARQFLPRLSDDRRAGLGGRGRVPRRACAESGAGAARPHPARRRRPGGAADLLPDRLADAGRPGADPSGGDGAGLGGRLGRGQRGHPDRQALRRAGHRDGVDRRQAGRGPGARAPTRQSTTPRPSWWPR